MRALVIPAKAGIQCGLSRKRSGSQDSRFGGNDS
jgi:hypothetical protein